MRKCIGILKKVFPQEDFGDKENNSPFPFENIFLGESNRTIQKHSEKKKNIFIVVTKKD